MTLGMKESLRIVVVAPDLVGLALGVADNSHALAQTERSRSLRIGLLENGYNLVAVLPGDAFLAERIRPILDVAMARFEHEQALRDELASTKTELSDRKVIDRAKGLLMQRQGLDEHTAYERLRKTAMSKNLKLVEVAQRMLDVADLLI